MLCLKLYRTLTEIDEHNNINHMALWPYLLALFDKYHNVFILSNSSFSQKNRVDFVLLGHNHNRAKNHPYQHFNCSNSRSYTFKIVQGIKHWR